MRPPDATGRGCFGVSAAFAPKESWMRKAESRTVRIDRDASSSDESPTSLLFGKCWLPPNICRTLSSSLDLAIQDGLSESWKSALVVRHIN